MRPLSVIAPNSQERSRGLMFKVRQIILLVLFLAQGIFETLKEAGDFSQVEERVYNLTQRA